MINITDDNVVEGREQFSAHILAGGEMSDLIIFDPIATVNIADNDGNDKNIK